MKKILITGASGFIGKNALIYFKYNIKDFEIDTLSHKCNDNIFIKKILNANIIIHLAGVNRPKNIHEFKLGNFEYTNKICNTLIAHNKKIPIIFTSTFHIGKIHESKIHSAYAKSKLDAENCLKNYSNIMKSPVYIFRLPHVIGKWCKPNYNSVVSTFCYNISRNKNLTITHPNKKLKIIHVDDLIIQFSKLINKKNHSKYSIVKIKHYDLKISQLVNKLNSIYLSLNEINLLNLSKKIDRILYSTFITYLPKKKLLQNLISKKDSRGNFVEVFKRKEFGQISFLTSTPKIVRGNHFHNMKCEIFIIISGKALYLSKPLNGTPSYSFSLNGKNPQLIRTVPGEIHSIKNIGRKELIVLVWANEVFNIRSPDTYQA